MPLVLQENGADCEIKNFSLKAKAKENLVFSIECTNSSYLDDIEIGKIKQFEKDIIEKIKSEKPEIIKSILSSGKLEEETEKLVIQVIEEYKKGNK